MNVRDAALVEGAWRESSVDAWKVTVVSERGQSLEAVQLAGTPSCGFIEDVAGLAYSCAKAASLAVPYTVIRELTENFVHADFYGAMVVVRSDGKTMRFLDSMDGEGMKRFIRGVGSGYPIVLDWVSESAKRSLDVNTDRERGWDVALRVGDAAEGPLDVVMDVVTAAAAAFELPEPNVLLAVTKDDRRARDLCLRAVRERRGWGVDDVARYFSMGPQDAEERLESAERLVKAPRYSRLYEEMVSRIRSLQ